MTVCSVADCDKPRHSRGWCPMHYQRWRKYGDPQQTKTYDPPAACQVDDCDRLSHAYGYCSMHAQRVRRRGTTALPERQRPLWDRFWEKVDASGDCWIWTGAKDQHGYGRIGLGTREDGIAAAHRVAYELLIGPIPAGLTIDHLCINPPCVNPDHLEAVSMEENARRSWLIGAKQRGEFHAQNRRAS